MRLRPGALVVLVLDGRLIVQSAPVSGDSTAFIPMASFALAYRF